MKQFAKLTLDIRDMSKKDKVFYFVEGLKSWARTKLYEQRIQDFTSAYAVTEQLFDLSSESQDARRHQASSSRGNKNNRPSSPKFAGGTSVKVETVSPSKQIHETTGRPNNHNTTGRPISYFICKGPHAPTRPPSTFFKPP